MPNPRRISFVAGALMLLLSACPSEHDPYTASPVTFDTAVAAAPSPVPPDPLEERAIAQRASRDRSRAAEAAAAAERARILREAEQRALAAQRRAQQLLTAPRGDVWSALARCESGGNPRAVGSEMHRGKRLYFYGAFQFTLGTWHSVGMSGNPVDYPYEVQLAAAQRLQARSGWGQWPHCARRLGLR